MDGAAEVLWDRTVDLLKDELSQVSYEVWIQPLKAISLLGEKLTLQAPTALIRDTVQKRYADMIIQSLHAIDGGAGLEPVYILSSEEVKPKPAPRPNPNLALNPRYTFSTFVVGRSNQFARAASIGAAESPGNRYNPLFIYSGTGLGKTHLMHAIGNYISEHNPYANIMYVTSERFTIDLISSLQSGRNAEFRERYRGVDVLLLDDIQFIAGKESTQEEFFHTFNALYESGKQIVLTSDKPPKEIPSLEERLRSRFEWGLIADIVPPDFETRVAILLKKAETENLQIADGEVMPYIANRVESNIRELEGTLTRVMAFAALTGEPVTTELTERALKDYFLSRKKRPITPYIIQQAVCEHFGISMDDLLAKRRSRDVAFPRQIAMYMVRNLTDVSLPKIGELFGGRDHTTVMHACSKITDDIENDENTRRAVEDITKSINE